MLPQSTTEFLVVFLQIFTVVVHLFSALLDFYNHPVRQLLVIDNIV